MFEVAKIWQTSNWHIARGLSSGVTARTLLASSADAQRHRVDMQTHPTGNAYPGAPAAPAAPNFGYYGGTGGIVPFVNHNFELGVVIAIFLSVLSIVPRHRARLTYFLHPKLRKINAVLSSPQLITLTLRRAGSIPTALVTVFGGVRTWRYEAQCRGGVS